MASTPVAITALGAASVCGAGLDALAAGLAAPVRRFGPPTRHAPGFAVTVGEAPDDAFAGHGHPGLDSPTGRLCLTAARDCLDRARAAGAVVPDGLVLGTSTGGQSNNEQAVFALLAGHDPGGFDFLGQGCMAAPARLVAGDLGLGGPVTTVSTACTSSANAIALGAAWIRAGRCRAVLAGGGDALCHTTISTFHMLGLTGEASCTPFGRERPGLTLGEGAAFLLLEPLAAVRARGATPLALLLGLGMSADAHHMTAPLEDGAGAELAMRRALDDAGLVPGDVHHVNAHGTGTRLNDAAEAAAVARLFGAGVPVASCKGLIGHTLGGAGALEAVAAVLSCGTRRAFANLGADTPDDDCPVTLVGPAGLALPASPVVLSNSFAFGGNNCALVFGAADREVAS